MRGWNESTREEFIAKQAAELDQLRAENEALKSLIVTYLERLETFDQLRARVAELESVNTELLDENYRLNKAWNTPYGAYKSEYAMRRELEAKNAALKATVERVRQLPRYDDGPCVLVRDIEAALQPDGGEK